MLVIGDGDTGFGGSGNVRRTIEGYARAGFAGISIEDQVFPKRCAYAKGLAVVSREEALARVRCAIDARNEIRARCGLDLVIVARTDCRHAAFDSNDDTNGGFEEVLCRCKAFAALGADVVYAEGLGKEELGRLCAALESCSTPVHTMLAQVERPNVTLITSAEAAALGCRLSLFGLTVLSSTMAAMRTALNTMANGQQPAGDALMEFGELTRVVGFDAHYAWEAKHPPDGV